MMENEATERQGSKSRPGFYPKPVRGMSITLIVLGVACFGIGVYVLVTALTAKCIFRDDSYYNARDYNSRWGYYLTSVKTTTTTEKTHMGRCYFRLTYTSPGLWAGAMFIASGIIGIITAKRKSTCFIVTMLILSFLTACTACGSVVLSIASNLEWLGDLNYYPLSLIIASSCNALLSLICFVLSIVKFGMACRALCYNSSCKLPKYIGSGYRPLPSELPMYPQMMPHFPGQQPQMFDQNGGLMSTFQNENQPHPSAPPVYLVQGNQVVGVLPPTLQFMSLNGAQSPQGQAGANIPATHGL